MWSKYCKKEHHIETADNLRLGGLHQYRSIEAVELRDTNEGRFDFRIALDSVRTTVQWCEEVPLLGMVEALSAGRTIARNNDVTLSLEGDGLPGSVRAVSQSISTKADGGGLIVANGRVHLQYDAPNALIFCMSGADDNPFEGYDAHWSITRDQVEVFSRLLAQRITARLFDLSYTHPINGRCRVERLEATNEKWPIEIFNTAQPADRVGVSSVGIKCRVSDVVYSTREIEITEEAQLSRSDLLNWIADAAFTKEKHFSREKELRFVFQPYVESHVGHLAFLSFDLEYLDIEIDEDLRKEWLYMQSET
ncbi:MAG: hypothetical protein AAGA71_20280 [Pseudomonadota bacterium]